MRKRNIKTVAHWVIMCFLLLFPIVLVGISAFANDEQSVTVTETYQYETNELNNRDDIVVGNIYKVTNNTFTYSDFYQDTLLIDLIFKEDSYINITGPIDEIIYEEDIYPNWYFSTIYSSNDDMNLSYLENGVYIGFDEDIEIEFNNVYCIFRRLPYLNGHFFSFLSESDYLGKVTTNVDIQNSNYKQEVNNWANGFKNLPVNQWYGQLLSVVGVGQTTSSVMNVIYVYPLYVLWVYLIDLILDCLLVIVNLGHNVLKRVDGDIE